MKSAKQFASNGYMVRPASSNDGYIVTDDIYGGTSHSMPEMASFSNSDDLLAWLSGGHRLLKEDKNQEEVSA